MKYSGCDCERCTLKMMRSKKSLLHDGTHAIVISAPTLEDLGSSSFFASPTDSVLLSAAAASISDVTGITGKVSVIPLVACRPPNDRSPTQLEIDCCKGRFTEQLEKYSNVLLMGQEATNAVQGDSTLTIHQRRGTVIDGSVSTLSTRYLSFKPTEIPSFLADVGVWAGRKPFDVGKIQYRIAGDLNAVTAYLGSMSGKEIVFDIETENIHWVATRENPRSEILCVAIAFSDAKAIIVTGTALKNKAVIECLQGFFNRNKATGHNAKFDSLFLKTHLGLQVTIEDDTMLMHYVLDENKGGHGLKMLASQVLGVPDYEEELIARHMKNRNDNYGKIPRSDLYKYAAYDVCLTYALKGIFKAKLVAQGQYDMPYKQVLIRAANALVKVEEKGIYVDVDYLLEWDEELEKEILDIEVQLNALVGKDVNPRSPAQLKKLLYEDLSLPVPSGRKMKEGSTSHEALIQLKGAHPVIDLLLRYRRVTKIHTSYVRNILGFCDENNRVHAPV